MAAYRRIKMKITVLDGYALNPGDLSWDAFKALGDLTVYDHTPADLILSRSEGADALITNRTPLDADTLKALPGLKYVGILATGYNVVDIDAARRLGIVVTNIPAYSTESVAQMVFAHIFAIMSGVERYTEATRNGRWGESAVFAHWFEPLHELAGMTIGIVGLGNIGRAVARIALAFGMKVLAHTSKSAEDLPEGVTKAGLARLFAEADIVTLHCPLTPDTEKMVDARRLALMKPTAILINTGRGKLIDEDALAEALNSRRIHAAGLDVLSTEPPVPGNPLLTARNCFITPHIAWATVEARTRLMQIAADNLRSFIAGHPVNNVARE